MDIKIENESILTESEKEKVLFNLTNFLLGNLRI